MLDEVVAIGYGTMKRSDVTGSMVSINDKAIEQTVSTSIDQVLQRAAGVQIQANSGTPGANTSIRIRGVNSLNATNQPIFVIDGVVVDAQGADSNDPLSSNNPLASINRATLCQWMCSRMPLQQPSMVQERLTVSSCLPQREVSLAKPL